MLVASRHHGIGSLHVPVSILPHESEERAASQSTHMTLTVWQILLALMAATIIAWSQIQLSLIAPQTLAQLAGSDLQGPTITHLINVAQQVFGHSSPR